MVLLLSRVMPPTISPQSSRTAIFRSPINGESRGGISTARPIIRPSRSTIGCKEILAPVREHKLTFNDADYHLYVTLPVQGIHGRRYINFVVDTGAPHTHIYVNDAKRISPVNTSNTAIVAVGESFLLSKISSGPNLLGLDFLRTSGSILYMDFDSDESKWQFKLTQRHQNTSLLKPAFVDSAEASNIFKLLHCLVPCKHKDYVVVEPSFEEASPSTGSDIVGQISDLVWLLLDVKNREHSMRVPVILGTGSPGAWFTSKTLRDLGCSREEITRTLGGYAYGIEVIANGCPLTVLESQRHLEGFNLLGLIYLMDAKAKVKLDFGTNEFHIKCRY